MDQLQLFFIVSLIGAAAAGARSLKRSLRSYLKQM